MGEHHRPGRADLLDRLYVRADDHDGDLGELGWGDEPVERGDVWDFVGDFVVACELRIFLLWMLTLRQNFSGTRVLFGDIHPRTPQPGICDDQS